MPGALIVEVEGHGQQDGEEPGESKEAVEVVLVEPP